VNVSVCVFVLSESEHFHGATHGWGKHHFLAASALKNAEVRATSVQTGSFDFESFNCLQQQHCDNRSSLPVDYVCQERIDEFKGGGRKNVEFQELASAWRVNG